MDEPAAPGGLVADEGVGGIGTRDQRSEAAGPAWGCGPDGKEPAWQGRMA